MLTELVTTDRFPGFSNKITHKLPLCDCRCADMRLVEPQPDGVERIDVDPLGQSRLVAQEPLELGPQGAGERVGEGRQQDTSVRVGAGEIRSPMQCDNGLAGAGRA